MNAIYKKPFINPSNPSRSMFVKRYNGAIKGPIGPLSELVQICPSVSRDMIRVVLNRLREDGKLYCQETGRKALWEKRGNKNPKRGNKRDNK